MAEPKRRSARSPSAATIVEEVLSAILSPRRVKEVIDEALRLGEGATVPESPIQLRVFVEGPLFSSLSRHLGIGDALDVSAQVRATLALALREDASHVAEADSSEVRERRVSNPASGAIRVLAVTQASVVVFLLQDMLGDAVEVQSINSMAALEDRLRRIGAQPSLIVVDRRHPAVGPDACRILVGHTPRTATVIWWGAQGPEQLEVEERLDGGPRLIPTHRDMELADLGELCRGVIELM